MPQFRPFLWRSILLPYAWQWAFMLGALGPLCAFAQISSIQVKGEVSAAVERNITLHLDELPKTAADEEAFMLAAPIKVERALQALGYYRAETNLSIQTVSNRVGGRSKQLVVQVVENSPTLISELDIRVEGEARSDPEFISLLERLRIKQDERLDHGQYNQAKNALVNLGNIRGYFDGELVLNRIELQQDFSTARVHLHYDSGRRFKMGAVRFDDTGVDTDLFTPLVPFQVGDHYDALLIHQLQNNLRLTGYFSSVVVLPDTQSVEHYHVPIVVNLRRAKRHSIDLGVGYATDTEFRVSLGWRTPMVNEWGHRQETKLEYSSVNPTGRFIYSIPLSHPLDDLLQIQFDVEDDEYADLEATSYGAKVGRQRNKSGWVNQRYLRYLRERWRFAGANDAGNYLIPGLSWSFVERHGPIADPSGGVSQFYTLEVGSDDLASDLNLLRLVGRWRWLTSGGGSHRFITRGELGAAFIRSEDDVELAPSLRFYAGGDQSIRGFAYQSIGVETTVENSEGEEATLLVGGTQLGLLSAEYQYYFSKNWRGAVFTDSGSVTEVGDFDLNYASGFGVHYVSQVGAIRLEAAYSLSEPDPSWRFHFNIGAEF